MVKDCCSSSIKDKQCVRKKDQKIFELPRKFSFEECEKPKGFTMRSSCAPYKDCYQKKKTKKKQKGGRRRDQDWEKNEGYFGPIMDKNGKLDRDEICRYCWPSDYAKSARSFCKVHNKVWDQKTNSCRNKKKISKKQKGGKKTKRRTNRKTKRKTKRRTLLPKLRPISYENKKHKYKLNDTQKKRRLAIDSGIKQEIKKGKSLKQAALSKKGRFNILRIYRKNNKYQECMTLTKDMKYIDKKYKLGKTNNICLQ